MRARGNKKQASERGKALSAKLILIHQHHKRDGRKRALFPQSLGPYKSRREIYKFESAREREDAALRQGRPRARCDTARAQSQ